MHMLDEKSHVEVGNRPPGSLEQKQQRRMQVALALLVFALIVVLYRDWQFLTASNAGSESISESPSLKIAKPQPKVPISKQPLPSQKSKQNTPAASVSTESTGPIITASNRAVLPPLEVEVVAGSQHRKLSPSNTSIKLDLRDDYAQGQAPTSQTTSETAESDTSSAMSAGNVSVSAGAAKVVSRPVQPSYPVLARQMKVQGAVVLRALIDKEGGIENLQVLSGPSMLSVAAREAVKQWHFKPFYQAGQPVETETRITVNFTISTN